MVMLFVGAFYLVWFLFGVLAAFAVLLYATMWLGVRQGALDRSQGEKLATLWARMLIAAGILLGVGLAMAAVRCLAYAC